MLYIITVYDSMNYGSYFQAHALEWELCKYDSVRFIEIHHQSTLVQTINTCIRRLIRGKVTAAVLDFKKYIVFKRAKSTFPVVDLSNVIDDSNNWYFYGSDEIWNISRPKILKTKEFFGLGLPINHRVAIAPSINSSTLEQFRDKDYICLELNKFEAISVRDNHSKEVIDQLIGRNCSLVADPTLMFDKEVYKKYMITHNENNYILLYSYGRMMNEIVMDEICKFAQERGLTIISVGRYFPFCDKNIVVSPEEFLSYIDRADYIFTDTFHGLMFSLIFEKQFLVFPCGNIKVEETLDILQIRNRLYMEAKTIDEQLDEQLDYEVINASVFEFGEKTRKFISQCMSTKK